MATFREATRSQGCGVIRSRSFFDGVGVRFLTTVEVWVRFFCPTPKLDHFFVTLPSWEFLLKWYNFLWNFCWNRIYAQSFGLWQQATTEIMRRKLSYYCLLAPHTYIFFAHIPFVMNHTINATPPERLQQHPLLFTTNHTDRTFFMCRLNSARPPHPGHSTILLRSEIPSGMCAKLRTVAASNNRDHASQSLLLLLARATHIYFFSLRTSRSLWITQSKQHHRRGCNTVYHNFYCSWQPNFIHFMLRSQKFGKVRVRSRSWKFWKGRSWSQKFYLWLCNPARSCAVSIQMFIGLIVTAKQTFMTHKKEHNARNIC